MEKFRFFLLKEGLEESTARLHCKLLSRLLKRATSLTKDVVDGFTEELLKQGRNIRYINQYLVAVKYFARYKEDKLLFQIELLKERRNSRYTPAIMSEEEIEAFIDLPNPYDHGVFWYRHEMWNLFWNICCRSGARMGEVASLRKEDIDLGRECFLFNGKTGSRAVPISFVILPQLKAYLEMCKGSYLFPSIRKTSCPHVKDMAWQQDFHERIKKLDSKFALLSTRKNLVPYSLRHSFGTRMAENDYSIAKIQTALGQKQLTTTQKYLHMSLKGVREMISNDQLSECYRTSDEIIQLFVKTINSMANKFSGKVVVNLSEEEGEVSIKIRRRD